MTALAAQETGGSSYRDCMDSIVVALRDQLDELAGLVADIDEADLGRPSPCPGWSVSDVLLHLAQTNDFASASAQGRWDEVVGMWDPNENGATVDQAADRAVASRRGLPGADVVAWWERSSAGLLAAFEACGPNTRVRWVAGEIAAQTLATTRLSETWVHTLDVAEGLGRSVQLTTRLWHIARLVHRTIPYAFAREGLDAPGPVRFALDAPDGGDRWDFGPVDAPTAITGPAYDLCRVAGQRADAAHTTLAGAGPGAAEVLRLMRTFASRPSSPLGQRLGGSAPRGSAALDLPQWLFAARNRPRNTIGGIWDRAETEPWSFGWARPWHPEEGVGVEVGAPRGRAQTVGSPGGDGTASASKRAVSPGSVPVKVTKCWSGCPPTWSTA